MRRYRPRYFGLLAALLIIPAFTCGVGPVVLDLIQRVEVIEELLFSEPTETVLLDDDFEDGIDPGWVQVWGTNVTFAPTTYCVGASSYPNCGSLGLQFDEVERYDFQLPNSVPGSFSLYFYDDPADTLAAAWIGVIHPAQEFIGLNTDKCPHHYALVLTGDGTHPCTNIERRLGWHRVEFVRDGISSKGYIDHILVFETNLPSRNAFSVLTLWQEIPWLLVDGFAIDDVRFVATE